MSSSCNIITSWHHHKKSWHIQPIQSVLTDGKPFNQLGERVSSTGFSNGWKDRFYWMGLLYWPNEWGAGLISPISPNHQSVPFSVNQSKPQVQVSPRCRSVPVSPISPIQLVEWVQARFHSISFKVGSLFYPSTGRKKSAYQSVPF